MSRQQPLHDLTLHDAADLLAAREITSTELTEAVLGRIENVDEKVKAFVTVTGERALADAKAADVRVCVGEAGASRWGADDAQGQHLHHRHPNHLLVQDA